MNKLGRGGERSNFGGCPATEFSFMRLVNLVQFAILTLNFLNGCKLVNFYLSKNL